MFACIKFVEDGSTNIVHLDEIQKSNEDKEGIYESSKTYKVKRQDGCYYEVHVLSVAASPEEATKLAVSKRLRLATNRCLIDENNSSVDGQVRSGHNQNLELKEKVHYDRNAEENTMSLDSSYRTFTLMKRIVEEKEKRIRELEIENKELRCLNSELQFKVIGKFEVLNEVLTNINATNGKTHSEHTDRKAAIAERRGGNVHIGKGMWLPQIMFDNIYRKKKESIFIKELAVAIFGEDVLKKSSLFGGTANRTREAGRPALDAKKLLVLKDMLKYRLQEKGVGKVQEEYILKSMKKILNEKIQDLRRGPRKNKSKKPYQGRESMLEETDEQTLGNIVIKKEVTINNEFGKEFKEEDPLLLSD